ncbi:hypothetical protein [Mesorhizobium sp. B1-1-8]|uniref:hypothetical protein n=1 Tax=Mesorhizobium sp. B1-1-8 TaxID=2589976 RepID=UPI001128842F|nr:hypothetical protein [Mesorhizobium sp. B1-1-8]UCI07361.1 hypothetical protein FJ974_26855 [Mesorhizobium sp. B1-1-8]
MTGDFIDRYIALALKRFGGDCSIRAEQQDGGIVFEFSVSGTNSRLIVDLGSEFTPTRIRSAFVELGLEVEKLKKVPRARS